MMQEEFFQSIEHSSIPRMSSNRQNQENNFLSWDFDPNSKGPFDKESYSNEENMQPNIPSGLNRNSRGKNNKEQVDRFIPNRGSTNTAITSYLLSHQDFPSLDTQGSPAMTQLLASTLFPNNSRLLSYKPQTTPLVSLRESLTNTFSKASFTSTLPRAARVISSTPDRILDAPEILDDYYLNLLDWGENNLLAVCLNQCLYLWNAYNGEIQLLLNTNNSDNYISSVSWLNYCKSNCLAVGFADNTIQLWDTEKFQPLRSLLGHRARVSSLSWNNWILSSGGRDTLILNHDVRIPNNIVSQFSGHTAEVCGLKWSDNCSQLASGGNDNNIYIWGLDSITPKQTFSEHKAAVKGLSWCPWQKSLLASGGGTADKTMKFWDTDKGKLLHSVSAESQVCSIVWNKFDKEVVSGHGYSRNQLSVWKYGTFEKVAELRGHTSRVLHLALSPDGSTVCSAGADETLRFWKVFETGDESHGKRKGDSLQNGDFNLR